MKYYFVLFAIIAAWMSGIQCFAQQLVAPGWNQGSARPGDLLFKHESGDGLVKISVIQAAGEQYFSSILTKSVAGIDTSGKCPSLTSERPTKLSDGRAWQIRASDGRKICSITLMARDATRAYLIVVIDLQAGATGAERFAGELLKNLSGDMSKPPEPARVTQNNKQPSAAVLPPANAIVAVYFDMSRSQINMAPLANGGFAQQTDFFNDSEVLFAGGVACRDCLEDWITDRTLNTYRRENPQAIGRWTKASGGYSVKYPDNEPARLLKMQDAVGPVLTGKRFNNIQLDSVQGRSLGTGESYLGIVQTESIFLTADGSFIWASENETFRPTMITEVLRSKSPDRVGRYSVSGYAIKLDYRSGKSEIMSLLTFPDEPGFLVINGGSFSGTKKR
jgi:hypothetical protein